jgi:HK97 family phage portal protein
MSLISRIFGGRVSAAPAAPVPRIEPVISGAVSEPMASSSETSGTSAPAPWMQEAGFASVPSVARLPRVSAVLAQRHATIYACCNVIAGDLAKVPLKLYQRRGALEERVRDHPAAYLLNVEAAPGVAASVLRFALGYAFTLRGNAFAYAPRDGAGELELLDLIRQDGCTVLRAGRARFYDFEDGEGVRRRAPGRAMVHLRYMAEDGWNGRSPLEVASESVGLALAGQEAAARTASGGTTRAVIKVEDAFEDDEAYRRNARRISAAIRNPELEGFPIIGAGDDIKTLDLSAADQELLASRKFDREQLAAIYRVPPAKLQMMEYGVKANGEQQAIDYLTDCLLHWAGLFEDQLALTVLTEAERRAGFFLRHDFGALLRPTTKERYEALNKAVGGPFMTPNEARSIDGRGPLPDGDTLNPAPNMTRTDQPKQGDGQ